MLSRSENPRNDVYPPVTIRGRRRRSNGVSWTAEWSLERRHSLQMCTASQGWKISSNCNVIVESLQFRRHGDDKISGVADKLI